MVAIGLVLKRSAEIARAAHNLEDSAVRCIMSRLMSLHDDGLAHKLSLHFESELENIFKKSYKDVEWSDDPMVRILEACHIQACP